MSEEAQIAFEQLVAAYQSKATERLSQQGSGARTVRKWSHYAAVGTAAFAGATAAEAQIFHFVPTSPISVDVNNNEAIAFDVDGDDQFDLQVGAARYNLGTEFLPNFQNFVTLRGYGGAIVPSAYPLNTTTLGGFYSYFVRRYSPGETISPFNANAASYIRTSQQDFTYMFHGLWGRNDTGYAAFALNFGQPSAQAGWVKVRTRRLGNRLDKLEVLEWAFETTPNIPIRAGATPSTEPVTGDYNGNGTVGPEDYQEWKNQFGQAANPAGSGADGNEDGAVRADDYTIWRDNLPPAAAGQHSEEVIPEPNTVTLSVLALGAAGVAALRRHSR